MSPRFAPVGLAREDKQIFRREPLAKAHSAAGT